MYYRLCFQLTSAEVGNTLLSGSFLSLFSPELMSESCCQALVSADCLPVLLELVAQTNRSQAALVVVAGIMRILP